MHETEGFACTSKKIGRSGCAITYYGKIPDQAGIKKLRGAQLKEPCVVAFKPHLKYCAEFSITRAQQGVQGGSANQNDL